MVEEGIHDDFIKKVAEPAAALKLGDPLDIETQMGVITNTSQMETVFRFVETATEEGGTIESGGKAVLQDTSGNYFAPIVVGGVSDEATLFQEEVFGPVLAATPFKSEE